VKCPKKRPILLFKIRAIGWRTARQGQPVVLLFLQMWRQTYTAAATAVVLLGACGRSAQEASPTVEAEVASGARARAAPDLILRGAAFARLVDGRLAAAGTATEFRYRHLGGRFDAVDGRTRIFPVPGGSFSSLGEVRLAAPTVEGDVRGQTAVGSGGVEMIAARGDRATTQSATLDSVAGTITSNDWVEASGPGYLLHGARLLARTDGSEVRFSGEAGGTLVPDAPPAPSPPKKAAVAPTKRGRR
jgi:hypothetical protein